MTVLLLTSLLLYGALGAPAFILAGRRGVLYWTDIAAPVLVVVLWAVVTSSGYGHQSLSHLVEVPIALVILLVLFYSRIFVLDRFRANHRANSYTVLGIALGAVVLLRTFMPYLPE